MDINHRIKRLEVALRVPDQELARDLQQAVSIFCRSELDELLQGAFDAIAPDRYIRIDRLELSLPAFRNADEFRDKLGERIRETLEIQLDDAEASAAAFTRTSSGAVPGENEQTPRIFETPYQAADVFIHILKYGVSPWHAMTVAFDDVVHEVIALLQADPSLRVQLAAVLSTSEQALQRFIQQTPAPDRRRMVSLITEIDESLIADIDRLLDTFVAVLTRGADLVLNTDLLVREIFFRNMVRSRTLDNTVLGSMLDEVITTLIDAAGNKARRIIDDLPLAGMEMETLVPLRWRQAVRDSITAFAPSESGLREGGIAASGQEPVGENTALSPEKDEISGSPQSKTVAVSTPDDSAIPGDRDNGVSEQRAKPGQDSEMAKDMRHQVDRSRTTEKVQPKRSALARKLAGHPQEIARNDLRLTDHQGLRPASSSRDSLKTSRRPDSADSRPDPAVGLPWMTPYETQEFHINNAGLVLVAPFLGMVFKDLGYLNKGRDFVTEAARIRAVHFSQYLVTSEQHPAECGLALNKIICGMKMDAPLERFVDLTQPESNAAREVLDSALEHWTALKRTSAPVFQQTFLQHEGILTRESSHWLLRIERISADVLIDTLPWTISIIKHPWMKQPVMVEW
jgi:hypothetical protein